MAQRFQWVSLLWHRNLRFFHCGLGLILSILFLSESVAATPEYQERQIAQQSQTTSTDPNRAAAERASAEGDQLFKQRTAESLQQAIQKYEEALRLWKAVGDRSQEASTLQSIGLVYYTLGDKQKVLEYYNQTLSLRRDLGEAKQEAAILWGIGGVYSDIGEPQKALDFYNQALSLFRRENEPYMEALTLTQIGQVYSKLGEQQKAIESFNQALSLQRTNQDRAGEALTLNTLGLVYAGLGEFQKALDSYNQAVTLYRELKSPSEEASTLSTIGLVYLGLGEQQKAIAALNQALSLQRTLEDQPGEALTLMVIGGAYTRSGEPQKALDFYNQALSLQQKLGNPAAAGEVLSTIGSVYDSLGEKQKALDAFNQALKIQEVVADPSRKAFLLNNIAEVYDSFGEKQKALDFYNQSLALQRGASNRSGEAVTLGYIGRVYSSLGNYQLSLESYNQTLSIQRAIGDRGGEAQTLDSIGGIYQSSGDHQRSLDFYNQSLSVWRADKNRFGEASTLTNIVRVYDSLGDYQKALDTATQARSLWTEIDDPFGVGSALIHMGRVYRSMGNYQLSLDSLNQGLSIMRQQGHRLALATTLNNLGKTYDALGESEKTLGVYTEALSVWRTIGDRAGEAEALYNIAGVERKRGNLKEALTQMESVIEIVESLRTKVASQELRSSYFASVQKYYEFYIDLLMQLHKANPSQGYAAKALQASESSRARGLLEILTEANADIRQGVDPKLLDQERSLQQQLDTLSQRQTQLLSGSHTPEQATALEKEISALLAQYQDVQVKIRATSPRYAALTQPQPLTLAEIQQQVLDDDTLLLEYSLGEERSYLWAVSKTGITSYELPKRADIEAAAQAFRDALTVPSQQLRPALATKAAKALSELILAPVANELGNKRLAVVRDGALEYVPFAALAQPNSSPDNKQYEPLVVAHEIVTLPSASTIALLRRELNGRQPAPKAIAVLADPVFSKEDERVSGRASEPSTSASNENLEAQQLTRSTEETGIGLERLPFTRNEAEQILSLVPNADRDQSFDFAASRAIATSPKLSKYRIVHFATHGILNSVNPELSGVVLSLVDEKGAPQNGFLRLHDVFNLNLPAELVVLSACQTGLGQEVKGEGLVGLTRGFMYAGAPRVMVSLWNVYDEGTSELMARFYKKMLQEKLKPAAALRAAQIEMLQEQQWQAPYYWAAFVLQGEWR